MKTNAAFRSLAVVCLVLLHTHEAVKYPTGYNCWRESRLNKTNGVYNLHLLSSPFPAICQDGWIVIQRRFNGSLKFDRTWNEYKNGFGGVNTEQWLGLDRIHQLTKNLKWKLRVDLEDKNGNTAYQIYNNFKVGDAASKYTLTLDGGNSGNASDSLTPTSKLPDMDYPYSKLNLNGHAFTTKDSDNDMYGGGNCARGFQGDVQGWWHNACFAGNLNGKYGTKSFTWYSWKDKHFPLAKSTMRIKLDCGRRRQFFAISGYRITGALKVMEGVFSIDQCLKKCETALICYSFNYNSQKSYCSFFTDFAATPGTSLVRSSTYTLYTAVCNTMDHLDPST